MAQKFSRNRGNFLVMGMFLQILIKAVKALRVEKAQSREMAALPQLFGRGGDQQDAGCSACERLDNSILAARRVRTPAKMMRFVHNQQVPTGANRLSRPTIFLCEQIDARE